MGLIQNLRQFIKGFPIRQSYSTLAFFTGREATPVRRDPAESVRQFNSWVYACVQQNAMACSASRLRVYAKDASTSKFLDGYKPKQLGTGQRKWLREQEAKGLLSAMDMGDVVELTDHPLVDLLEEPSPFYTRTETFDYLFSFLDLTGNAFWYIEYDIVAGRKVPARIWPLLTQYVTPVLDAERLVKAYRYGPNRQNEIVYDASEIIHFRYFNPSDPVWGTGPLQAAMGAVKRISAMNTWEAALWENQARPDFAIKSEGAIGSDDRKALREDLMRMHRGPLKSGVPILLPNKLALERLSFDPKDTNHLDFAHFSREEIAACFDVPMPILEMSVSNKASAAEALVVHARDAVLPRLARAQDKLNKELCPLFDTRIFVAYDNPVPEDRALSLAEERSRLLTGVWTPNEVRAQLGDEDRPGGEVPLTEIRQPSQPAPGSEANPGQPKHLHVHSRKSLPPLSQEQEMFAAGLAGLMNKHVRQVVRAVEDVER